MEINVRPPVSRIFRFENNRICVGLIILFSALYFFPYIIQNKTMVAYDLLFNIQPWKSLANISYKNTMMGDVILQFAPWHVLYRNAFLSGEIPFWNPFSAGGMPFMANQMSSVFYPLNLIFLALPLDAGFSVFGIIHKIITGLGMFFLLRQLHLRSLSSLIGAVTWMFCGYLTTWLPWLPVTATLAWLPWSILLVDKIIIGGRWFHVGWLAVVVGLIFLGGHIQFAYYAYLTILLFMIWRVITAHLTLKVQIDRLGKTILGLILGLSCVSIQLIPTLELSGYSIRGVTSIRALMAMAIPSDRLLTLVIPDLFGGVNDYLPPGNYVEFTGYIGLIGIVFVGCAVLFPEWKKRKELWFFPILAIGALHLAYGGVLNLFMQVIPGYTLFRTIVRNYALWSFAASGLAAIGAETIIVSEGWRRKLMITLGVGFIGGGLLLYMARSLLKSAIQMARISFTLPMQTVRWSLVLFFAAGLAVLFLLMACRVNGWQRYALSLASVALILMDLIHFSRTYLPTVDPIMSYPVTPSIDYLEQHKTEGRIARFASGFLGSPLSPNIGLLYGLEDIDGYDSLFIKKYSQFVGAVEAARFQYTTLYNQMFGFEKPESLNSPLLQILRVAYLLSENPIQNINTPSNTSVGPIWSQVYAGADMVIYHNQRVLPLGGIYGIYEVESNVDKQISRITDNSFNPAMEVLLGDPPQNEIDQNATGTVKILQRTYNNLVMEVNVSANANKSALLLIGQNNYPGWEANIDGFRTPIYSADYILQAVVAPPGSHVIRLSFLPSHFTFSLVVTFISLLIIMSLIILDRKIDVKD